LIWESQPNEYLVKLLREICLLLFANDLIRRHSTNAFTDFSLALRQHERIVRAFETADAELVSKSCADSWHVFCDRTSPTFAR
jgi:DNA-binding GntR family transcriptional regulator